MLAHYFNPKTEQGVLRLSIVVTIVLGGFGIAFGLLASSSAIIFDGIYDLTDAGMTFLALLVSKLIAASSTGNTVRSKLTERFTMGFWHLEPIVLGFNGTLLLGSALYALVNAVDSFLDGGRRLELNYAIIFTLISLVCTLSMALFASKANQFIRSELLALDAKSWFISTALSIAWLVAFTFGMIIEGTYLDWMVPYIDPAVLAIVCLVVIPLPISNIRQAVADILLVTPADLKKHVDEVAQKVVERYGFIAYRAYVARVGRGRQIELYFIVPMSWPAKRLEEWDELRDQISEAIGEDTPDRWLTIVFTTDLEWAE
ncbi:cation transporter [Siphonobacter sp. BAB-5385]|uniref:cation diffusion facilitator family transporter n=1 Tax=unclassified Siphonobacter TaxID=2635712 RepID=UPI000B9EED53|nr:MULTISPECIES: cation transporter [unclassified Siphonobacter]OZI06239.1 cation transporter [Siphonobacter sp. BAB-5385]PMD93095.1 cation transporter [Siphonobacter sp. BAB-5405]